MEERAQDRPHYREIPQPRKAREKDRMAPAAMGKCLAVARPQKPKDAPVFGSAGMGQVQVRREEQGCDRKGHRADGYEFAGDSSLPMQAVENQRQADGGIECGVGLVVWNGSSPWLSYSAKRAARLHFRFPNFINQNVSVLSLASVKSFASFRHSS